MAVVSILRRKALGALVVTSVVVGIAGPTFAPSPSAQAVPAPEVEYTYNVMIRRHFDFPNVDALGYGWTICDRVARGDDYGRLVADVKADVVPNDEFAVNYLVANAVGVLCPAQIWRLRNSAANY